MFGFLILMLVLAVLTNNTQEVIVNDKIVEREFTTENQLTNEIVSENILKN